MKKPLIDSCGFRVRVFREREREGFYLTIEREREMLGQ